jgi:hypothetical protein
MPPSIGREPCRRNRPTEPRPFGARRKKEPGPPLGLTQQRNAGFDGGVPDVHQRDAVPWAVLQNSFAMRAPDRLVNSSHSHFAIERMVLRNVPHRPGAGEQV